MKTDTIAAIATSLSDAGIGIIRISGGEAIAIGNDVFRTPSGNKILDGVKSHTIHYGYIVDSCKNEDDKKVSDENIIDEVMVAVMRAPKSYTTEDTVEINCHGGVLVMKKILETVIKHGARMAEPGEFTKRAFLNGRIDLSRAEAVIDVIHSQNELAYRSALGQLKGNLSQIVKKLREDILFEIAFIESALDDPEHISLDGYTERLCNKVTYMSQQVNHLIQTADDGKLIKEGISTVIIGKPNAGKSSLLNLLVGEDRAIVTDVAGTTRDVLQETIQLHGIGLNIIDTAGIRDTEDIVEKIGVEKAKKYAQDADLIIYVVDASVSLDESDTDIINLIGDKHTIILLNKADLETRVTEEDLWSLIHEKFGDDKANPKYHNVNEIIGSNKNLQNIKMIRTSTKENIGMEELESIIKDLFFKGKLKADNEIVITNMRHKAALIDTYESLRMVKQSLDDDMPEDFYSIDLMSAYASLGTIIGEEVGDDLVNEIFSKFCMGK